MDKHPKKIIYINSIFFVKHANQYKLKDILNLKKIRIKKHTK